MRLGIRLFLAVAVCLAAGTAGTAYAQWKPGGTPVISYGGTQQMPDMAPDGAGGVIIVWQEQRSTADIYAQRLDRYGNKLWQTDGVPVCSTSDIQVYPRIAADGAGGAVICWMDYRSTTEYDIYAQRIDADGNRLWTPDGVAVCTAANDQMYAELICDGSEGAVIVWQDFRASNWNIYTQRLDSSGNIVWQVNGNVVCMSSGDQMAHEIIADGVGGAIVVWQDARSGNQDIYAYRYLIDSSGTPAWTLNGIAICSASYDQRFPSITPDGAGGAIIAWEDIRNNSDYNIHAQRVSQFGTAYWPANGLMICNAIYSQYETSTAPDGEGGAIIAWRDYRDLENDIYAQRVDSFGRLVWPSNGIPICTEAETQDNPLVIADGQGGAFIAWEDMRSVSYFELYLQHVYSDGSTAWATSGIEIAELRFSNCGARMLLDETGGAVITWGEQRIIGDVDIYAQRIEPLYGMWGRPEPSITAVRDVPADEGGVVTVEWKASQLDAFNYQTITHYSVWRALNPISADWPELEGKQPQLPFLTYGTVQLVEPSDIMKDFAGPAVRVELTAQGAYYWEWIANIDAYYLPGYMHAASTLHDSTGTDDAIHYFQVISHTADQFVFWVGEPDSGYSVDNLAPCPPIGVALEQKYVPEGLEITWEANTEADLDCYVVHRGSDAAFPPDGGNLVYSGCEPICFDEDWRWDNTYWYKIAAVDIHGNISGYVLVGPEEVTGEETPTTPAASYLSQNYPNPFNPVTMIRFGIAARCDVSLRIYDAAGRLVRTLIDETRDAGHYTETWDGRDDAGRTVASGVYFCDIRAGAFTENRKMVLLR